MALPYVPDDNRFGVVIPPFTFPAYVPPGPDRAPPKTASVPNQYFGGSVPFNAGRAFPLGERMKPVKPLAPLTPPSPSSPTVPAAPAPTSPAAPSSDPTVDLLNALTPLLTSAMPTNNSGGGGGTYGGGYGGTGAVPISGLDENAQIAESESAAPSRAWVYIGIVLAAVGAWYGWKAYKKHKAAT